MTSWPLNTRGQIWGLDQETVSGGKEKGGTDAGKQSMQRGLLVAIGFDLSKGVFPHLEKTLIAQRSQTTDDLVTNKII